MSSDLPATTPAADPSTFGIAPDFNELLPAVQHLCEVIAKLRSPEGCPWDRQQTLATIKPYTLEETYELLEAIDSDDNVAIQEELGDVLLQVVLDSQIASDERRFQFIDVVKTITEKMIHRHPHVFGSEVAETTDDVKKHWHAAKNSEKSERTSRLEGIPKNLPQLARTHRIAARAASIPDADRKARAEGELGDVLFVMANIARRWGINPEEALRKSNAKFSRRFQAIEAAMKSQEISMEEATLQQMEDAYQAAKAKE
ncbi:UNVERIFIED_CONTAM: hypothetical protein GTU68_015709 [Idotea baltica]|nr:hypothetical protein [Idotea baltica]